MTGPFDTLLDLAAGPAAGRLAAVLLHVLWQGAAVAAAAALCGLLIPAGRVRPRYAADLVWFAVLLACPAATWFVVGVNVSPPSVPDPAPLISSGNSVSGNPVAPPADAAAPRAVDSPSISETDATGLGPGRPSPVVPLAERSTGDRSGPPAPRPFPGRLWLLAGWAVGVGCGVCRLLLGGWAVHRLRRAAVPAPAWLAVRCRTLAGRMGFRRPPAVRLSRRLTDAAAAGWLRPVVLLPAAWATHCPPDLLGAALAHELAHLRRGDPWVTLLQRVAETLLFYHPAVWWLSGRVRRGREFCRDADAARATGDPAAVARCLAWAASHRPPGVRPAPAFTLPLSERTTVLTDRVHALLGTAPRRRREPAAAFFAAALLAVPLCWATAFAWADSPPRVAGTAGDPPDARREPAPDATAPVEAVFSYDPVSYGFSYFGEEGVFSFVHEVEEGEFGIFRPIELPGFLDTLTPSERLELAGRLRSASGDEEPPPGVTRLAELLESQIRIPPGAGYDERLKSIDLERDRWHHTKRRWVFTAAAGRLLFRPTHTGDISSWEFWRQDGGPEVMPDRARWLFENTLRQAARYGDPPPPEVAEFWREHFDIEDAAERLAAARRERPADVPLYHEGYPRELLNRAVTLPEAERSREAAVREAAALVGAELLFDRPSLAAGGVDLSTVASRSADGEPLLRFILRVMPAGIQIGYLRHGTLVLTHRARIGPPDLKTRRVEAFYPMKGDTGSVARQLFVLGDRVRVRRTDDGLRITAPPAWHPVIDGILYAPSEGREDGPLDEARRRYRELRAEMPDPDRR